MDSIRERFGQKLDAGVFDDVEQKRASGYDIKAFIKEELNGLAESVEKRQFLGNVGEIEHGFNQGIKDAATTIRIQANLL